MGLLSLLGRISLDASPFHSTLRGVKTAAASAGASIGQSLGSGLKGQLAGFLGVGSLIALGKATIDYGDSLDELAERLGITTDKAHLYSTAAKLGGADSEFFATRFEKLRKAMSDGKTLEAFGINAATAEEAIDQLANKIQTTGLNTEELVKFVDLFGKGSGRLINVLGDLKSAGEGVLPFDSESVENAKVWSDLIVKMGANLKSLMAFSGGVMQKQVRFVAESVFGVRGEADPEGAKMPDEAGIISRLEREAEAKEEAAKRHQRTQEEVLKLESQIKDTEEENRVGGLSREERMNELLANRAKLQHDILFALTEEQQLQIKLAAAKNESEILKIERSGRVSGASVSERKSSISSDSLSSIGNFLGQSTNSPQLKQLSEQTKYLKSIDQKVQPGQGLQVPL